MKNVFQAESGAVARGLLLACALAWPTVQAKPLRLVTEATPYTYMVGARVAGPATEVVEKTLQSAGLTDFQVKIYPWARAYDMALKEPGVLIFLIARTPVRETQFKWAGEIMKIQYHLYRLRERTDVVVKTLVDAQKYSIGVMRDDVRHQYLQSKGFTRLVVSAQGTDNFNKLIGHQVDLVPMVEDDLDIQCTQARIDCARIERVLTLDEASTGLYMAYSNATADDTVQKTRAAFDKLKADGTVRKIMQRKP
ncbi:MAG: family 3 extracellular solute-binding protein [Comamonadaceae bacterium]|nr:MAG: family 3 extracellular solute-binding protein [Comamonadaceae bacterium]